MNVRGRVMLVSCMRTSKGQAGWHRAHAVNHCAAPQDGGWWVADGLPQYFLAYNKSLSLCPELGSKLPLILPAPI